MLTVSQLNGLISSQADYTVLALETLETFDSSNGELKILAFARMIQSWVQVGVLQNYARDEEWDNWPEVPYADLVVKTSIENPIMYAKAQVVLRQISEGVSQQEALRSVFGGHLKAKLERAKVWWSRREYINGLYLRYRQTLVSGTRIDFQLEFLRFGVHEHFSHRGEIAYGFLNMRTKTIPETVFKDNWVTPVIIKSTTNGRMIVSEGVLDQFKGVLYLENNILLMRDDCMAIRVNENNNLEVFILEPCSH